MYPRTPCVRHTRERVRRPARRPQIAFGPRDVLAAPDGLAATDLFTTLARNVSFGFGFFSFLLCSPRTCGVHDIVRFFSVSLLYRRTSALCRRGGGGPASPARTSRGTYSCAWSRSEIRRRDFPPHATGAASERRTAHNRRACDLRSTMGRL